MLMLDGATAGLPVHPGPRPEGDPSAIRAYADRMRSVSGCLLTQGSTRVDGLDSPKGRSLSAQAASAAASLSGVRTDLRSAAAALDTAAQELTEDIRRWTQAVERYDRAVDALRKAAQP